MKRPVTASLCLLAAVPAIAGPIDDACNAAGFAAAEACDCMQVVAEDYLSAEDQTIYVAVVQRQTSIAQLAATRGQDWTEGFVNRMTSFATDSHAQCGAP